ncbi:MAG: membrane protein insertase YidC [Clostridia bacterium]|nr:membrane protein insertase YidC [Clostridia bacterium]
MNKKTTLGKLLPKIALLLALLTVFAVVMTGCGSNTVIDTSKDAAAWKDTEVNLDPKTDFVTKLLTWIGVFLNWITKIMPANSYILTLLVFAIILEIVMLPFSIKQQKNSIRQAKLKPKEMAIRKKYAGRNDQATQQKVSQEIQELYQKENFNPMSGCLPMLFQLPIIFVLYWLIIDPIQYVVGSSAEFTSVLYTFITTAVEEGGLGLSLTSKNGSIEILSKIKELGPAAFEGIKEFCANGEAVFGKIETVYNLPANFTIGELNFGLTPPSVWPPYTSEGIQYWLIAVPVLTFVVQFFSMKLNRKFTFQPNQDAPTNSQTACSNTMMDITMPAMSAYIAFIVPAAVGIYWMFKGIIGTVKQFIMSKAMPLPQFTEEDYKAAEKEMLGKQPKKIQKSENAGKVRSLHHIDDEDYDEQGNYNPKPVEEEKPEEEPVKTELPENKMTEGATLKDDSDKSEKKSFFGKKDKEN